MDVVCDKDAIYAEIFSQMAGTHAKIRKRIVRIHLGREPSPEEEVMTNWESGVAAKSIADALLVAFDTAKETRARLPEPEYECWHPEYRSGEPIELSVEDLIEVALYHFCLTKPTQESAYQALAYIGDELRVSDMAMCDIMTLFYDEGKVPPMVHRHVKKLQQAIGVHS